VINFSFLDNIDFFFSVSKINHKQLLRFAPPPPKKKKNSK